MDDWAVEGAVAAVAEMAVVEEVEAAVLVDDSGLVDAMDINMAAADTVLSVIGMTLAAALFSDASATALAATAVRDGELGELVGAVNVTIEDDDEGKESASLTESGGGVIDETAAALKESGEREPAGAKNELLRLLAGEAGALNASLVG